MSTPDDDDDAGASVDPGEADRIFQEAAQSILESDERISKKVSQCGSALKHISLMMAQVASIDHEDQALVLAKLMDAALIATGKLLHALDHNK